MQLSRHIGVGGHFFMLLYFAQKKTKIFRKNKIYSFKNNFKFNFEPDPHLNPQIRFFHFSKLVIL